ncbi:MAG: chorismate synthase [Candidatus Moranbacteria bacterium]|nr:chorismate synthase [Candidatus Moranbacteria bacterium]
MRGNTFGKIFSITTAGESHGGAIAVIVDGCPAKFKLEAKDIQKQLNRRRPGQSNLTTTRKEADQVEILAGLSQKITLGTPILMIIKNKDARNHDYEHLKNIYRPSHADFSVEKKYGIREWRGGGRASARETAARVAGGAIAKKYLKLKLNIKIYSYVEQIGPVKAVVQEEDISLTKIENNPIRCPDPKKAQQMIKYLEKIKKQGDSTGGVIRTVIKNTPLGLGEPVFDKLSADLGKAMLSINAVKGFELGAGFASASMKGSEHNDLFHSDSNGHVKTKTNFSAGIQGGISNGQDIYFRVAFKPVATINQKQTTVNTKGESVKFQGRGRHDACVVPRAVPIVEAMSAITLLDHYLRQQCYR